MKQKIVIDKFFTKILRTNSYRLIGTQFSEKELNRLNTPFFLTIKSNRKIYKKNIPDFFYEQITFIKKYRYKIYDNKKITCRLIQKKDYQQVKNISLEKTSNSRLVQDINLKKNLRLKLDMNG